MSVCICLPKDLAYCWTDLTLLYSKASCESKKGFNREEYLSLTLHTCEAAVHDTLTSGHTTKDRTSLYGNCA